MEEIRLTPTQAVLITALIHAGIGFVLGLIPLILGIVKKKVRTGVIGIIVGTLGGAILGFLVSIPSMAAWPCRIGPGSASSSTKTRSSATRSRADVRVASPPRSLTALLA